MTPEETKANIAECERVCNDGDFQGVMILKIAQDGTVVVSSYADTPKKCKALGGFATSLLERGISTIPFRTAFGHGWDGIPMFLTAEEVAQLSPDGLAYARSCGEKV